MSREARSIRCPESVLGWIPWYGETDEQGRPLLDVRQRGAVEAHAAQCSDCRAELDMVSGAPFEIDVDLPDPDRMFEEITARIDSGEAEGLETAPAPPGPDPRGASPLPAPTADADVVPIEAAAPMTDDEVRQLTRWVLDGESEVGDAEADPRSAAAAGSIVRGPWGLRPLHAAAAAAAIFLFGLFGGVVVDSRFGQADEYILASAPERAAAGALLDVVFVEGVTVGEIGEGLRAAGLEIVSGPSSVGRYRLRAIGVEGPEAEADLQVIASRLKAGPKPLALFAEPASP